MSNCVICRISRACNIVPDPLDTFFMKHMKHAPLEEKHRQQILPSFCHLFEKVHFYPRRTWTCFGTFLSSNLMELHVHFPSFLPSQLFISFIKTQDVHLLLCRTQSNVETEISRKLMKSFQICLQLQVTCCRGSLMIKDLIKPVCALLGISPIFPAYRFICQSAVNQFEINPKIGPGVMLIMTQFFTPTPLSFPHWIVLDPRQSSLW